MDHLEEFLGYMNSHERYMQVLQEFAEETEEDEPDVGWCWDDLRPWSKLMMPGDPDAMGCILSHYTMYFVFYRWEYQMSLGEEKKHNIAVHSARSHTVPDVYRVLIADNPSWNDGFADAAPGLRNLKSKCPSWRSFLENLVGWIPGGGFADIERADGVCRPVRENVVRHLPPNAHGIRTATAIGLVHLGGIRPHQACLAKRSAVVESPPRPLAPGEVDDGRPRSRIEVNTRNIKSNFFNLERMIPIEGSGPLGTDAMMRRWLRLRDRLDFGEMGNELLGCTSEALSTSVNRAGRRAGYCHGFFSCTGLKAARINEIVCDATIATGGSWVSAQEIIQQRTGHHASARSERFYLRPLCTRIQAVLKERPGQIESVDDLNEDELYPTPNSEGPATRPKYLYL